MATLDHVCIEAIHQEHFYHRGHGTFVIDVFRTTKPNRISFERIG